MNYCVANPISDNFARIFNPSNAYCNKRDCQRSGEKNPVNCLTGKARTVNTSIQTSDQSLAYDSSLFCHEDPAQYRSQHIFNNNNRNMYQRSFIPGRK